MNNLKRMLAKENEILKVTEDTVTISDGDGYVTYYAARGKIAQDTDNWIPECDPYYPAEGPRLSDWVMRHSNT